MEGTPKNGIYKPASAYADHGTPIVRIDSFYDGIVADVSSLKRVRLTAREVDMYGIKAGDLLVNRVNSIDYVGKTALVPTVVEDTVFESNIMRVRLRANEVMPEFAILALCSPPTRAYFKARAKPAVAQVSVNQRDVGELPLFVPPVAEQENVVRQAHAAEEAVNAEERSLAKLYALKKGLIEDLLTGQVRVAEGRRTARDNTAQARLGLEL
jgi:type I restriction enzyme S subunit